jgi:hypothetical protein
LLLEHHQIDTALVQVVGQLDHMLKAAHCPAQPDDR